MFPPLPNFKPLVSTAARQAAFGKFDFVRAPIPGNKENISIKGDWARKNLVTVSLPQLLGIEGAPRSLKVTCHKLVAASLVALFEELEALGLLDDIHTWGGTFCPRLIRGSTTVLSNHAFASAFDINAAWNGYGKTPAAEGKLGCVYRIVPVAARHRFYWGGHFTSRPDGMHFEYVPK